MDVYLQSTRVDSRLPVIMGLLVSKYTPEDRENLVCNWFSWKASTGNSPSEESILEILKEVVTGIESSFIIMLVEKDLKDMPLYINSNNEYLRNISRWRLSCGK